MMPIVCIKRWQGLWVCSCLDCRGRFFLYSSLVLDISQLGGVVPVIYGHGMKVLTNDFVERG